MFPVLQKFRHGFSGRMNNLSESNLRNHLEKSQMRTFFFAFKHFSSAQFRWIKEENEDENDGIKVVTPSLLPRSHFRPAVWRMGMQNSLLLS